MSRLFSFLRTCYMSIKHKTPNIREIFQHTKHSTTYIRKLIHRLVLQISERKMIYSEYLQGTKEARKEFEKCLCLFTASSDRIYLFYNKICFRK